MSVTNADRMIDTLDLLVHILADPVVTGRAPRACLLSCEMCRNSLLYLLDTVPYTGNHGIIEARIRNLPEVHRLSHQNTAARDHGDSRRPQIRGLA